MAGEAAAAFFAGLAFRRRDLCLPAGFIAPCLPTKTDKLPSGSDWPHEIKHDGIEGDGPTIFAHTCKLGLEGIVSKRKDSAYRSGRSSDRLKMKNANAPAVMREAEDWGKDDPHAFAPV